MSAPYAEHYTPTRTDVQRDCHGCGRPIQAKAACWLDDRCADAVVCGRCVMEDPEMHLPAAPVVIIGQTRIELR